MKNGGEDLYVLDYLLLLLLTTNKEVYVYVFLIPLSCAERDLCFYVWIMS